MVGSQGFARLAEGRNLIDDGAVAVVGLNRDRDSIDDGCLDPQLRFHVQQRLEALKVVHGQGDAPFAVDGADAGTADGPFLAESLIGVAIVSDEAQDSIKINFGYRI